MKKTILRHLIVATLVAISGAGALVRAQQGSLSAADKTRRWEMENELQSIAVVERKVMIPMPDGVRLATDIYRPKNAAGKVPVIWVRTPYNFNFWDVQNGVPADMSAMSLLGAQPTVSGSRRRVATRARKLQRAS